MKPEHQAGVLRRLRIAKGHLEGVIRMVEQNAYCPDVMKQLAAIQGSVEGANRLVLRNHLETCVAEAVREGRTVDVVDELMEALRFDPGPAAELTTVASAAASASPASEDAAVPAPASAGPTTEPATGPTPPFPNSNEEPADVSS
jgi:DNA-binding FrmR family transcriptional regulator